MSTFPLLESGLAVAPVTVKRRIPAEELRSAADLQHALQARVPTDMPGYVASAIMKAAGAVGGDYYDFLHSGGIVHFAIGDVTGSGTAAAMLATALRALVRAHWFAPALADAVHDINRTFHDVVPDDRFATLFMGRLHLHSGRLEFVNAAHDPGLLVRASGAVERLSVGGTVVGSFREAAFEAGSATLHPGDTLLLTSDGISGWWETLDAAHSRLAEIVRSIPGNDVEAIQTRIFAEIGLTHVNATDDSTVLVLRRRAALPPAA